MSEIYKPSEDSYLLSEILKEKIPLLLKQNPNLKFLEIGAGSGIHLETAHNLGIKKQNIFSVDISPNAVNHCNLLGFNCIQSDLFENIKGKYNIIVFNPPYLPEDAREPCDSKTATTGGKKGCEIINEFLKQAKDYLVNNGKIFLLVSSLTKKINWKNWKRKKLGEKKLFFERLVVWKLIPHHHTDVVSATL